MLYRTRKLVMHVIVYRWLVGVFVWTLFVVDTGWLRGNVEINYCKSGEQGGPESRPQININSTQSTRVEMLEISTWCEWNCFTRLDNNQNSSIII